MFHDFTLRRLQHEHIILKNFLWDVLYKNGSLPEAILEPHTICLRENNTAPQCIPFSERTFFQLPLHVFFSSFVKDRD